MKKISLNILFLLLISFLNAQNFKDDMSKVKQKYNELKHYQCHYQIEVSFDGKSHSKVDLDVKVSDSNYHYKIGNEIISVSNSEFMLTVDNDLKMIAIAKRNSMMANAVESIPDVNDSNYTVEYKKLTDGDIQYTIQYKQGELSQSTLTIDPNTWQIKSIAYNSALEEEYEWRKYGKRSTVITFSNLKSIDKLPESFFSLSKYIVKTKQGYETTSTYKTYQLLDTTIKPE